MAGEPKGRWEIAEILMRPLGGLLTALSVAAVGFWGSHYLENRQAAETNVRLYAELMSSRERADSDLRKNMFNMAIGTFLEGEDVDIEKQLLELELLAYNFHDALDLAPLFKHVERKLKSDKENAQYAAWTRRLTTVAQEVINKQTSVLEDSGHLINADVSLRTLESEVVSLIDEEISVAPAPENGDGEEDQQIYRFTVEALDANVDDKSLLIRLKVVDTAVSKASEELQSAVTESDSGVDAATDTVAAASGSNGPKGVLIDATFNVDFFDFPMIDNSRLPDGYRCAVVLRTFDPSSARVALVTFPASRASLKDKPFYDEIIDDLMKTRAKLQAGASK